MFTTRITPRISETDGAGHINNVYAPVWLEAGRREIFRILNPDLDFATWHAVIVNVTVDYVDQMFVTDDVEVRTRVAHIGTRSFRLHEEIWQGGRRCVEARATYVYFDPATQRAQPIPADERAALEVHLEAD